MSPSDLSELVGGRGHDETAPVARGRVVKVSADEISVVVSDPGDAYEYDVPAGQWAGTPVVGQPCLVLIDDQDDAWVLLAAGGGGKGVIIHGDDAYYPRPAGLSFEWHGSVLPFTLGPYDTACIRSPL
jgi:hypothetical protein